MRLDYIPHHSPRVYNQLLRQYCFIEIQMEQLKDLSKKIFTNIFFHSNKWKRYESCLNPIFFSRNSSVSKLNVTKCWR